jgi:hypothetical protein
VGLRRAAVAAVVAAAGLGALCGCGGGSGDRPAATEPERAASVTEMSAAEVIEAATAAIGEAESVRAVVTGEEDGQHLAADIAFTAAGDCVGTMAMGDAGEMEMLRVGEDAWVRGDEFLAYGLTMSGIEDAPAVVADILDGRYVHSAAAEAESLAEMCSAEDLTGTTVAFDGGQASLGQENTVDGVPVVTVHGTGVDGERLTMLVAAEGTPYPLRYTARSETGATSLRLTYGEPLEYRLPTAQESIEQEDFQAALAAELGIDIPAGVVAG